MRTCLECGSAAKRLARQRCDSCYPRHIAALKAAGTFTPMIRRRDPRPAIERVLSSAIAGPAGCVIYTGELHEGYGLVAQLGTNSKARAHRVAYQHFIGEIPDGMHLDHVCHTDDQQCPGGIQCLHRRCVNPHHLEAVTPAENNRRSKSTSSLNAKKTHCPQDHLYDEANTLVERDGSRRCRKCANQKRTLARRRQRARELTGPAE